MHVVLPRTRHHHAALLAAMYIPAAPAGLVSLLFVGRVKVEIDDSTVEVNLLFPVLDAAHLFWRFRESRYVVASEGVYRCRFAGQKDHRRRHDARLVVLVNGIGGQ